MKKKLFVASSFKKNFNAEHINGVYVPSYLFSSDTYTRYTARLGEHYTVTVGTGDNRRTETRTRWFYVSGELSRSFKDIIVEATRHITQHDMDKIAPYNTDAIEGYQREYLAGFSAESPDANLDQGMGVAKKIMDNAIQREALSRYHYDVIGDWDADTVYSAIGFHYALVPLWIFGCKHKDKYYRYIVNGRTGRSYGKYPVSVGKVMSVIMAVLAVLAGVATIIYYFGMY